MTDIWFDKECIRSRDYFVRPVQISHIKGIYWYKDNLKIALDVFDETGDLIEKTKISVREETLFYSLSHSNGVCHSG